MADQVLIPRSAYPALNLMPISDRIAQPWYRTVADNVRDALFPQKQPPLHLTSRPVRVREIWGAYDYKRRGGLGSAFVHAAMIALLIYVSVAAPKIIEKPKENVQITYMPTEPDKQVYTPT